MVPNLDTTTGKLATLAIAVLLVGVAAAALAPATDTTNDVTVEETDNGVVITNTGDTPATATVDSALHAFNVTLEGGESTLVPPENANSVTVHN